MVKQYPITELIKTGRLGPLHVGMSMGQLASVLGPPQAWIAAPDDPDAVPNFWDYPHLEFSFANNDEGKMSCNWFQFDCVMCLKRRTSREANDFSVGFGNLGAASKPSDYLAALSGTQGVVVQLENEAEGSGTVIRVADTVKIIFDEDETDDVHFKGLSFVERVRIVQQSAYCHCITSSHPNRAVEEYDQKIHGKSWVTPDDYMRMLIAVQN